MSKTKANVQYTASGSDKPAVGDVMVFNGDEHVPKKFGVYFTYHTFAIKGVIPSDTFFPGFIINKAGESGHTQTIEKISARTRSGSCQFVVYKRGAGSSTDSPILPNSSGSYITAIALGVNSTTGCPYALTDNDYIFIKTLTSTSTTDLSVTITIKHVA
jgi:hypothetical protein